MDSIYSKEDQEKIMQIKNKLTSIDKSYIDPEVFPLKRKDFVELIEKKKARRNSPKKTK